MFRLIFLAFYGSERFSEQTRHHLHESPPTMTVPLIALAVLSTIGGFVGLAGLDEPGTQPVRGVSGTLAGVCLARGARGAAAQPGGGICRDFGAGCAASASIAAYRFYIAKPVRSRERWLAGWPECYRLLTNKYYVDETYDAVIVHPVAAASKDVLWRGVDDGIIDGAVNGTARTIQGSASLLKHMQNGLIRSYAAWILVGTVALLLYITLLR